MGIKVIHCHGTSEFDWQTLTLRDRARHISFSLNAKAVPLELRGEFWRKGKLVKLDKNGITINSVRANNSVIQEMALVGMPLGVFTETFTLGHASKDQKLMFVVWPNRRERLWRAKEAWKKFKSEMA